MARDPIPTWYFAVVVVRHEDRFLLVHERKHGQLWYLPAGRVEFGETLAMAACRETLEETGVSIRLTGLLHLEHSPVPGGARVRAVFLAEATGDTAPKSVPDEESLGAAWVSVADLTNYPLRHPEVVDILRHVAGGATVYPLSLLRPEGGWLGASPRED
jgi:8-oxo-dGTP pyrophosphatase MutT (NUDIX family)